VTDVINPILVPVAAVPSHATPVQTVCHIQIARILSQANSCGAPRLRQSYVPVFKQPIDCPAAPGRTRTGRIAPQACSRPRAALWESSVQVVHRCAWDEHTGVRRSLNALGAGSSFQSGAAPSPKRKSPDEGDASRVLIVASLRAEEESQQRNKAMPSLPRRL
jgi:hypothetical protein